MAVFGNLEVRGWPANVRIKTELHEGRGGPLRAGRVKLRIKKAGLSDSKALGENGVDDLFIDVNASGVGYTHPPGVRTRGWNWTYWKNQGYSILQAECEGAFWAYDLEALVQPRDNRSQTPVPTSISEVHVGEEDVSGFPDKKEFLLTWNLLDQSGNPVAGSVSRHFDGVTTAVASQLQPGRLGVCVDSVAVTGFGVTKTYTVIPPTGKPVVIKLQGPAKPAEIPPVEASYIDKFTAVPLPDPASPGSLIYAVCCVVMGTDSKPYPDAKVYRLCTGVQAENLEASDSGFVSEQIVCRPGDKLAYTVMLAYSAHPKAMQTVELIGTPKVQVSPAPQLHSMELLPDSGTPDVLGKCFCVLLIAKGRMPGSDVDVPMPGVIGHWTCDGDSGNTLATTADGNQWFNVVLPNSGTHRLTVVNGVKTAQANLEGQKAEPLVKHEVVAKVMGINPDQYGYFGINIQTYPEGKPEEPAKAKFEINSSDEVTVKVFEVGVFQVATSSFFQLETEDGGNRRVWISLLGKTQADLYISSSSGKPVRVPLTDTKRRP